MRNIATLASLQAAVLEGVVKIDSSDKMSFIFISISHKKLSRIKLVCVDSIIKQISQEHI